jgi:hypothetical protein
MNSLHIVSGRHLIDLQFLNECCHVTSSEKENQKLKSETRKVKIWKEAKSFFARLIRLLPPSQPLRELRHRQWMSSFPLYLSFYSLLQSGRRCGNGPECTTANWYSSLSLFHGKTYLRQVIVKQVEILLHN